MGGVLERMVFFGVPGGAQPKTSSLLLPSASHTALPADFSWRVLKLLRLQRLLLLTGVPVAGGLLVSARLPLLLTRCVGRVGESVTVGPVRRVLVGGKELRVRGHSTSCC